MPDTAADTRPRLLLLDGHSLAYRAFFALPVENFSTSTGQPTNAVYGFTSMLINVLRDEQPTHVAVAFDKSRQTFRLEQYADYKAKRNKTPSEFSSQLPLIKEVLDALHIKHLDVEGYEADDIIATLTTQAAAEGFEVLICTGDRDSFQLVSEHTTVIYPMRGVSEMKRMTPEAVMERYDIPPARYPELAALVGEDSDNLPGVPGSTPTTASTTSSPVPTRSRARPATASASTSATSSATGSSTPWSATCRSRSPRPTSPSSRGTGRRCTRCSTDWSSGSCATACSRS